MHWVTAMRIYAVGIKKLLNHSKHSTAATLPLPHIFTQHFILYLHASSTLHLHLQPTENHQLTYFCNSGGNQSNWTNPTQAQEEYAKSAQKALEIWKGLGHP